MTVSKDFLRQVNGFGLTTAVIYYWRPDYKSILQIYVWQEYDLCPQFPEFRKFFNFWKRNIEGRLHSVTLGHSRLIKPDEIRAVDGVFRLN